MIQFEAIRAPALHALLVSEELGSTPSYPLTLKLLLLLSIPIGHGDSIADGGTEGTRTPDLFRDREAL